jgi:hypothetical protein
MMQMGRGWRFDLEFSLILLSSFLLNLTFWVGIGDAFFAALLLFAVAQSSVWKSRA